MMRQFSTSGVVLLAVLLVLATGCRPQQPFYFFEDGDLSHYIGVATEIDYPDVETASLDEVDGTLPPLTLENSEPKEIWDLSLEEAMHITLRNSKVIRNLGGVAFGATGAQGVPEALTSQPTTTPTVYGPAQQESNPSVGGGVEQALSAFDAQLSASAFWEKNDRRVNSFRFAGLESIFPSAFREDVGNFTAEISKTAATGATFTFRNNTIYDANNNINRELPSDWSTKIGRAHV